VTLNIALHNNKWIEATISGGGVGKKGKFGMIFFMVVGFK